MNRKKSSYVAIIAFGISMLCYCTQTPKKETGKIQSQVSKKEEKIELTYHEAKKDYFSEYTFLNSNEELSAILFEFKSNGIKHSLIIRADSALLLISVNQTNFNNLIINNEQLELANNILANIFEQKENLVVIPSKTIGNIFKKKMEHPSIYLNYYGDDLNKIVLDNENLNKAHGQQLALSLKKLLNTSTGYDPVIDNLAF